MESLSRKELIKLNTTELITLGIESLEVELGRHVPRTRLVDLLAGDEDVEGDDLSPTHELRQRVEKFLEANIRFLHQAPSCSAKCTEWGCHPFTVLLHYQSLRRHMV